MAGQGPAPKPPEQRRRRNATVAMTRLPASGRSGPAPKWPIGRADKEESAVWRQVWATPQAVAWERLGWTRTVARYVRCLVASEKPDAAAALLAEVRQLEDRLGLSPMAMLRLRWEVDADEVSEARTERKSTGPKRWAELRVVDAG